MVDSKEGAADAAAYVGTAYAIAAATISGPGAAAPETIGAARPSGRPNEDS